MYHFPETLRGRIRGAPPCGLTYLPSRCSCRCRYLTLVHAPTTPAVILLEEPENGIHPRQLGRIASYLTRLTDPARGAHAVQILLATHSPYFLDHVPPEDVLVFGRKQNGETVARDLLSLPGVRERIASGFSLGEMWFNVGEDRLLAEALQ